MLPQLSGSFQSQISELNNDLTSVVTSSQIGSGTKNFSINNTRKRLLCITKKSGVIVESKEIPISVLETGDVIPLGDTASITLAIPRTSIGSNTGKAQVGDLAGLYRENADSRPYDATTGALLNANSSYGLETNLSNTTGASITYNGSNSFIITVTKSNLSVYVY